jgi:hypothetical protein
MKSDKWKIAVDKELFNVKAESLTDTEISRSLLPNKAHDTPFVRVPA